MENVMSVAQNEKSVEGRPCTLPNNAPQCIECNHGCVVIPVADRADGGDWESLIANLEEHCQYHYGGSDPELFEKIDALRSMPVRFEATDGIVEAAAEAIKSSSKYGAGLDIRTCRRYARVALATVGIGDGHAE